MNLRKYIFGDSHWLDKIKKIPFHSGLGQSAWLLYGLCKAKRPDICVEIGSARGMSACFIGQALKENGKGVLYAIDPHAQTEWNDAASADTYEIFMHNIAVLGLERQVTPLRMGSSEAAAGWDRPIDVLFIDGDHSYEGVKADWDAFHQHVKPFGFIVFHDTMWESLRDNPFYRPDMGVPRFVEELRRAGFPVITSDQDYGVTIVQPTPGGVSLTSD